MEAKSQSLLHRKTFLQVIFAIPLSLVFFTTLALVLLFSFELGYANRIYPGVYVDDLDLSGLSLDDAGELLAEALPYSYEGKLRLYYAGREWEVQPIDLGYLIDPTINAIFRKRRFSIRMGVFQDSFLIVLSCTILAIQKQR